MGMKTDATGAERGERMVNCSRVVLPEAQYRKLVRLARAEERPVQVVVRRAVIRALDAAEASEREAEAGGK